MQTGNQGHIVKLSVGAETAYIPEVAQFIRDMALKAGIDNKIASKIELMTEEAAINVVSHAFDPGEKGSYNVILARRPGQVIVAVEDQGLPLNIKKLEADFDSGMSLIIMKNLADEMNFVNLGMGGKRTELVLNLPYKTAEDFLPEAGEREEIEQAAGDEAIHYRLMVAEDAVELARCVYRSYGYSYVLDTLYYPEKLREKLQAGTMVSMVAVNSSNEIVGHFAMNLDSPDDKVGEVGMAVTDPRYRGRGIFKKLKQLMIDFARERAMYGIYSESVTPHPYTQKGNVTLGAHETAVLPAYIPPIVTFRKIDKEAETPRRAVVIFYLRVGEDIESQVYPPERHAPMIEKIYKKSRLKRDTKEKGSIEAGSPPPDQSRIDINVIQTAELGFMKVREYGGDFIYHVKLRLKEMCLRKVESIYLDLPLTQPATQHYCSLVESLGFFFCGIIPELDYGGDYLRLCYLNNVDIMADTPCLYTDFTKELYRYILDASGQV